MPYPPNMEGHTIPDTSCLTFLFLKHWGFVHKGLCALKKEQPMGVASPWYNLPLIPYRFYLPPQSPLPPLLALTPLSLSLSELMYSLSFDDKDEVV